jgi:hypothetical protein
MPEIVRARVGSKTILFVDESSSERRQFEQAWGDSPGWFGWVPSCAKQNRSDATERNSTMGRGALAVGRQADLQRNRSAEVATDRIDRDEVCAGLVGGVEVHGAAVRRLVRVVHIIGIGNPLRSSYVGNHKA